MTAASRIFTTTAFRSAALVMLVLAAAATLIVVLVTRTSNSALTRDTIETLDREGGMLTLLYMSEGLARVEATIAARASVSEGRLYRLTDAGGRLLAGNLAERPVFAAGAEGGGTFHYAAQMALLSGRETERPRRLAAARVFALPDGHTLVVARDIERQREFIARSNLALGIGVGALAIMGFLAALLMSRSVLARVDAMTAAGRSIMRGNMSERLPRTPAGDEFDRLADGLNAMLDRIEQLMAALKEVSDNIAHDLKTPLNRLRNRAEAALADPRAGEAWRTGLEQTIEDADELMKTFNALLLIARLEAGAVLEAAEPLDIGALAADMAELYAPAAEDAGIDLALAQPMPESLIVHANRRLVAQALANLIENAIKYAPPPPGARAPLTVGLTRSGAHAEVIVADRGAGIPPADRPRAMRRFVRLDPGRSKPGTGLGLSLVAAVAQLHGGGLRLEDNEPGLRAVLSLPMMPPDRPAEG